MVTFKIISNLDPFNIKKITSCFAKKQKDVFIPVIKKQIAFLLVEYSKLVREKKMMKFKSGN